MSIEDLVEGLATRVVKHSPVQLVLEAKDKDSVRPLMDVLQRAGYVFVYSDLTREGWFVYATPREVLSVKVSFGVP